MRSLVLLLLSFSAALIGFSQETLKIDVLTKDYKTDKKDGGVTVKIYDGSTLFGTYTSSSAGKVEVQVPVGKVYKVEASKSGKVTRFITVNTKGINAEVLPGNSAPSATFSIGLFDQIAGVDYSSVSGETTEFYFDGTDPALKYDNTKASRMQAKVEKLLKDTDALKGQNDANYNAAIKEADAFYVAKKYTEALASYEKALGIKPTEAHPAQRINEIEGILKAQKANSQQNEQAESEYKALIAAADNLFAQKKYEEAIGRYKEALTKKVEQYPNDQITKANTEIARLKTEADNAGKYTAAIQAADGFMGQKSYQMARDKYKEALKWKKDDAYATGKLAELETKLNALKTDQDKKKKFDDANAAADLLFNEQKWVEAKAKYNEALAIEPSSAYTQGKITEINAKLAEIEKDKAKADQIAKLLAEGNTAFAASQWPASKTKYQEVLKLDAANATATARLTEIEAKLNAEKADADKLAKIKELITAGDALAKQTKLPEAKAKYVEAVGLKADPAVQAKIDAIDAQIATASQKAEQKANYDKAMADGETLFTAGKYEEAKGKFNDALAIDGLQPVPKQRIIEADKKIAEGVANAKKSEQYTAAMSAGAAALTAKDLAEAKKKYQEAVALDGTKAEAKTKLAEVEALIASDAKAKENEQKYVAAVKAGTDLLEAGKLAEAKTKFTEASGLDPAQALPKQKITEIDNLLAQAEKQKQVDALLKAGNTALDKKDLAGARTNYQQVLTLDPGNAIASAKMLEVTKLENDLAGAAQKEARFKELKDEAVALIGQAKYPEAKQKLIETQAIKSDAAIDQLIIDVDKKIAEGLANAKKNEQYAAAMTAGAAALTAKNLPEAKKSYQEAIAIDGTKAEAKTKLAEVEAMIAGDAKAKENELKYQAAVKAGTDLLEAGKLAEAKAKFTEASGLDPAQALPKQKITEIDNLLAQADKQKQIDGLLKDGATAFDKKDLPGARTKYQQVLTLEPANSIASARMLEISKLENDLAGEAQKEARFKQLKDEATALMGQSSYQEAKQKLLEAKAIKTDAAVDQLIKECDTKIAELAKGAENDKLYTATLGEAQALEGAKKYDEAIAKYNEALKIKDQPLPKERIAAINQIKNANAGQAKLDAEYAAFMKKGKEAFDAQDYLAAIPFYQQALGVKPNEKEPAAKIAEAEKLEREKGMGEFEEQYQKVLSAAKKNMDEKNYVKAKEYYNRALTIKSDDPFPKVKLAEIEELMKAEQAAQEKLAAYNKKVSEAEAAATAGKLEGAIALFEQAKIIKPDETVPDNRIAQLRAQLAGNTNAALEAEQRYQALMTEGNTAASGNEYQAALGKYQEALAVKKNDKPAQDKISEMRQLLDNLAKADSRKAEVQGLITKADTQFSNKKWMDAKGIYEQVLVIDPSNKYASDRIALCDKNANDDVAAGNERNYQKLITAANESFNIKNYDKAKDYYQRAVKVRNSDPYPKRRLAEIDAILNPSPVPAVAKSTEPEPLPNLGEPNNALNTTALQNAETERNNRRYTRHEARVRKAGNQDTMISKQLQTTESTNLALDNMALEIGKQGRAADVDAQGNTQLITGNTDKLAQENQQSDGYEVAENLYSQSQLDVMNKTASEQNSELKGTGGDNSQTITKSVSTLTDEDNQRAKDEYGNVIENKDYFTSAEIKIEQIDLDDTESRRETEDGVIEAKNAVIVIENTEKERTDENLEQIKTKIDDFAVKKTEKDVEDAKSAPANNVALVDMEAVITTGANTTTDKHYQNSLTVKQGVDNVIADVVKSTENSDNARQENVEVILENVKAQDDKDRLDYNAMVIKSLSNDASMQSQSKDLNAGEAAERLSEKEKTEANQQSINDTRAVVEVGIVNGTQKASDNDAILNEKRIAQDEQTARNVKSATDKTQASTQGIADVNGKETVYGDKPANDVGKLYPEGVSQEQFEQKDADGLLKAVVTRRIVVVKGHGTVYVRNQTLNGITYSRNGEPSTEYAWQQETMNPKLVKNY